MPIDTSQLKSVAGASGVYRTPEGRYFVRAALRLPNGKSTTQRRLLPVGATKDDAIVAVQDLKRSLRTQQAAPTVQPQIHNQMTVADFAKVWLKLRTAQVKPSTAATYELAIRARILPRIGSLPCTQVNRSTIEGWTVWALSQSDAEGRPYSHATLQQWWRVLCNLLRDMAADLHLPDPLVRATPPRRLQEPLRREQRTIESDDLTQLLTAARTYTLERYLEIAVLALTGMRSGELYALQWDAVDLQGRLFVVRRSVSLGQLTETTKTKSQRTVPMHPILADLMTQHKADQQAAGIGTAACDLVFPSRVGTPRTTNTLRKAFRKIAEATGTQFRVGPQVLRRSMNSNLLRENVDRLTIRSIMGHTTEQMTARYYGAGDNEKMAAVMKLPAK